MTDTSPDTASDRVAAQGRFKEFLGQRGLRVTAQRIAIFEAAYDEPEHYTAEELLNSARAIDRSVSRATVYRTLPILTESGVVREIDVGKDYKFYVTSRGQRTEQAQVVCRDCERIFEIEAPFMEWYASNAAARLGLEAEFQRLQVHARCIRFEKLGECENRTPVDP